jgi:DNA-binding CsgD family transcriptional regulator
MSAQHPETSARQATRSRRPAPAPFTPPRELSRDGQLAKLTRREREVLALWQDERFNDKQVAGRLGRKEHTIRNQLASIEHKLGLRSRAELAAMTVSLFAH